MATVRPTPAAPGSTVPGRSRGWQRLLWAMVFPRVRQRFEPTLAGLVLIGLSLGVGMAAYNSANNILFITLSLLLACLILSGLISWLNLRRMEWRLQLGPPVRAGQATTVVLQLRNGKAWLPTYGLWFDLRAFLPGRPAPAGPERPVGLNLRERRRWWRERLAAIDRAEAQGRIFLRARLDPRSEQRLEWTLQPDRRGRWRVAATQVGSLFPFGFLRKHFVLDLERDLVVWPAVVEYRRQRSGAARVPAVGERTPRTGQGTDLLAVRHYVPGDSPRLVHWKASAHAGHLLVRQQAAESQTGLVLCLDPAAGRWPRAEQFELAVSLAATLAEDLFRAGQLRAVILGPQTSGPLRSVSDLEAVLDRLAVISPATAAAPAGAVEATRQPTITLHPDGARGVLALLDEQPFAQA